MRDERRAPNSRQAGLRRLQFAARAAVVEIQLRIAQPQQLVSRRDLLAVLSDDLLDDAVGRCKQVPSRLWHERARGGNGKSGRDEHQSGDNRHGATER